MLVVVQVDWGGNKMKKTSGGNGIIQEVIWAREDVGDGFRFDEAEWEGEKEARDDRISVQPSEWLVMKCGEIESGLRRNVDFSLNILSVKCDFEERCRISRSMHPQH